MSDKNYHLDCVEDLGVYHNHTLTGKVGTFLQERFAQEHSSCFQKAALSLVNAIEVLMVSQDQPWVCLACMMSDPHHLMMSTTQDPCCRTCGMEMAMSVKTWSVQLIRSLLFRTGFELDSARDSTICNFAQVGEQLLAPHGEKLGMFYLLKLEPGNRPPALARAKLK